MALAIDHINNIYIVIESVRNNKSLAYYIKRKNCVKKSIKVQILFELAKTLNYLHRLEPGIIHRNLNPECVFITNDFSVKLSGFR